jgi:prophage regulatory protein
MINFDDLPDSALIRIKDLLAPRGPLPFKKSTLYVAVKEGRIAPPVHPSPGISAFRVSDIRAFLRDLKPRHNARRSSLENARRRVRKP